MNPTQTPEVKEPRPAVPHTGKQDPVDDGKFPWIFVVAGVGLAVVAAVYFFMR